MIRTLFTIGYLFFVAFFTTLEAQEVWSLDKCINYALENNITIKQGMISTEYQKNQLKQQQYSRLPNLNAQLSQNMSFGKTLTYPENTYRDINTTQTDFGVSTNVIVFQGFQINNVIKQTELNLKASMADLERAQSDISLNIASTYLQILFSKELVKIAEEQLGVTELQLKQISDKVEAGSLAKGALLDIEAQKASEELNLINAQNQLRIYKLQLTQVLELPSNDNFDVEVPRLPEIKAESSIASAVDVFKTAVTLRPEIKAADLRYQASLYQMKVAKGNLYPSISMYGSFYDLYNNRLGESGNTPFSDQIKNNQRKGFGLQMNIPIFNRFTNKLQIDNARLQSINYELELEKTKKLLRSDVETVQTSAIAALNRYLSNQKAVSSMKEAFRYSEEKFSVGLVNAVEYNTAKNKLTSAESNLLQAKYDFIFRTKILDFYRGLQITL